ncbi:MAG: hypothetical protein JXR95_07750 [Deltaproteobacteria bacterium]|nr:hypothetical protein [Deltaproteobacteria bacterium]
MGKKRKNSKKAEETGGGWMMGMRGGFKSAADSVTGNSKKKSTWFDWVLNVVIVLMIVYLLYKYFH